MVVPVDQYACTYRHIRILFIHLAILYSGKRRGSVDNLHACMQYAGQPGRQWAEPAKQASSIKCYQERILFCGVMDGLGRVIISKAYTQLFAAGTSRASALLLLLFLAVCCRLTTPYIRTCVTDRTWQHKPTVLIGIYTTIAGCYYSG